MLLLGAGKSRDLTDADLATTIGNRHQRNVYEFDYCLSPINCSPARVRLRDRALGDATSYIAKYISKWIDGFGVGIDGEDRDRRRDAVETCVRAEAWAALHGIRQFQFFGGPAVSVWREVRRLNRPSLGLIEAAREAAEAPNWTAYIRVQGGVRRTRSGPHVTSATNTAITATPWPVRVHKVCSNQPGLWGDPVSARIVGVEIDDLVEVTREREWVINWPGAVRSPGSSLPRSPVNNCTRAYRS